MDRCFRLRISLFFLFLGFSAEMMGQYHTKYLSIEDGLVQNSVTDIFQDSEGYMWFTTQDGISQYDGYQFTNYTTGTNDSFSLSDNFLWGLQEDTFGYIWACSRSGLNRINKRSKVVHKFHWAVNVKGATQKQVDDVVLYQGYVYVSVAGKVFRFQNRKNIESIHTRFENQTGIFNDSVNVRTLLVDRVRDNLYLFNSDGIYDSKQKKYYAIPSRDYEPHSMPKSAFFWKGKIWFTDMSKVWHFDLESKRIKEFPVRGKHKSITVVQEHDGYLYVGTNLGLTVYDNDTVWRQYHAQKGIPDLLSSNLVSALNIDDAKKMWVGTGDQGLTIFDPLRSRFGYWSEEVLGTSPTVMSICQATSDRWLIGTNTGLFLVSRRDVAPEFHPKAKVLKEIYANDGASILATSILKTNRGDFVVGTSGQDVLIFSNKMRLYKRVSLRADRRTLNRVTGIVEKANGDLWLTTYYGLFVLNSDFEVKQKYYAGDKGLGTSYYLSLYESATGDLWIGGNTGFIKYVESSDSFIYYPYDPSDRRHSPGFNFISGFHDFGDGHLWVASYGGGLARMNLSSRTFEHFGHDAGLNNLVINALSSDARGHLWMSTNKGLSRFDPKNRRFTNFTMADGLRYDEFNLGAFYKGPNGEMHFGTPEGTVFFSPEEFTPSRYIPKLSFHQLSINFKDVSERLENNRLDLFPKDKILRIRFGAFNYSESKKVRYKFFLKNYMDQWIETSDPEISYSSLPAGKYELLVKATNVDGEWTSDTRSLLIVVHPPFYATTWFRLLVFGLILAIGIGVVRYFAQRKMKKKLLEMSIQQSVYQEKQRISRDLHDNLGAQITYLISCIDQESYNLPEEQTTFDGLSDKARNVMSQLRQSIWVLSKESITLKDFRDKITDYSTTMLSATDIALKVNLSGDESCEMQATVVNNLFRVVQEAINNVMKHSAAQKLVIDIDLKGPRLKLRIQDFGKGFDQKLDADDHFGMKNMEQRTVDIGGDFAVHSVIDEGTTILIDLPIS